MNKALNLKERQNLFFQTLKENAPTNNREEIYTYAYQARLRESLLEDFPVSIKLSPDFFDQHFGFFCQSPGSRSWSLNHLAHQWFEYIRDKKMPPWLRDLYQFELFRFMQIFLSEKTPTIAPSKTLNVFDELELTPTQEFLWLSSNFDLEKIWKEETPPLTERRSLVLFFKSEVHSTPHWTFETIQGNEQVILEKLLNDQKITELPENTEISDLERAFTYLSPIYKTTEKKI